MRDTMIIDNDAFSHSQIKSKLWLCGHLEKLINEEKVLEDEKARILIHGGWYGLLAFILHIRENIDIDHITSIDIDYDSIRNAALINQTWVSERVNDWDHRFQAVSCNSNKWEYQNKNNIVINTSTEHFDDDSWFRNIPNGKIVVLQSTDMEHPTHINLVTGLSDMVKRFPMSDYYFKGSKFFAYSKVKKFYRFMLIGVK